MLSLFSYDMVCVCVYIYIYIYMSGIENLLDFRGKLMMLNVFLVSMKHTAGNNL